jgi:hypothetical protein
MVTLIVLIINMANVEPEQTVHLQKYETVEQCQRVGEGIIKLETDELKKRGALNKNGKSYQITFRCIK